ncbi:MAG: hypothetical protein HUK10_09260 [Bacteroides heparinolyticus]|nr:hypothetical protein [Bacteroides heparinolyticus]
MSFCPLAYALNAQHLTPMDAICRGRKTVKSEEHWTAWIDGSIAEP